MSINPQSDQTPAAPAEPIPARWHFPAWLVAALLGVMTLALYWPATHDDFINCDDPDYVTENPHVQGGLSWAGVKWAFANTKQAAYWAPVMWLSHMLGCQLFGLEPGGHHLINVLLHAANTALVFLVFRLLTGAKWRSLMLAALFGWHPLRVESVAWVTERKDMLSGFFGLLTLLFYARYARESGARSQKSGVRMAAYFVSLLCFALGLMSKAMLVTVPCVLLLLDYWPLRRFQTGRWWPLVIEKIPFFILAVAASAVTYVAQKVGGAVMDLDALPLSARVANALVSYCRYVGKMFWPANLAAFYPHPGYWPWVEVVLAALFLGGLSLLLWVKRARHPFLLVGWLWFVGMLVPVIQLVQSGQQAMADRFTYLPSIGLLTMVIWGVEELTQCWRCRTVALLVAGSVAVLACVAVTRHQLGYWRNSETLFRHALAVTKNNFFAHDSLGMALGKEGQTKPAIAEFEEALRLKPDNATIRRDLAVNLAKTGRTEAAINQLQELLRFHPDDADAHFDLANLLADHGQTDAAIQEFRADLRVNPDDADAHFNLGKALLNQGQADTAIGEFQTASRLKTYDAAVYYNLGNLLAKSGQNAAAISQFQEAIHLNPNDADAHNNLGNLLAKTGQTDAAISELQAALRFNPNDADTHYNLGNICLRMGRMDDAISELNEAIRLKPGYAPAHYNLAVALNKSGQIDSSIAQFQEAIRLQPDYAFAYNSLGVTLAAQGRITEAISQFQEALRIKPDYTSAQNNLAKALALKSK